MCHINISKNHVFKRTPIYNKQADSINMLLKLTFWAN